MSLFLFFTIHFQGMAGMRGMPNMPGMGMAGMTAMPQMGGMGGFGGMGGGLAGMNMEGGETASTKHRARIRPQGKNSPPITS